MSFSSRPIALGFATLFLLVHPLSQALAEGDVKREASIVVSGEGDAGIAPDMAIVSISVVKLAETAEQALSENAQSMAAVLAALKQQGIAAKDLQTSGLSIQPQYIYPGNNEDGSQKPPELVGYQVTNALTVRLYDVTRLGAIIDQSVKLGINQGAGVQFSNKNPKPALEAARRAAVADGMSKARTLAEAAGVKLGRLIEVSELSSQAATLDSTPRLAASFKEAPATPIEAGENNYHVTVNVTFAIEQ